MRIRSAGTLQEENAWRSRRRREDESFQNHIIVGWIGIEVTGNGIGEEAECWRKLCFDR